MATTRSDGIPIDTIGNTFSGPRWTTANPFSDNSDSFTKNDVSSTRFFEDYTDLSSPNTPLIPGTMQKQHVIPIELYNNRGVPGIVVLRELSETKVDGVRLFHPNDFKINGLALPTDPVAARLLDASMHNGGDGAHLRYNAYVRQLVEQINEEYNEDISPNYS